MNTDAEWEKWGQTDPYYGVLTSARFRNVQAGSGEWDHFFATGENDIALALERVRAHVDASFEPTRALDFGCGVGRVAIPLARRAAHVVGVDVSAAMLEEARRNARRRGVGNVEFMQVDDGLSGLPGPFDFIHSLIVFQHIPVARGLLIFQRLLQLLQPGGVAALHFTYAKQRHADTFGVPPWRERLRSLAFQSLRYLQSRLSRADPVMEMNLYPISRLLYIAQAAGVQALHVEPIDHAGVWGVHLVFRKHAAPSG